MMSHRYKNTAAVNHHLATPYLAALLKAENDEQLKRADNQVFFLNPLEYQFERPGAPN